MDTGKSNFNNIQMVSVFCMVYNHEPYLHNCLEGFLMQKCDFNYQIVIGEDCSSDKSRTIILEYAQKCPEKFKLLLHEKNVGAAENQKLIFENCRGKYIAMCEGDDYWTDPYKLQKQVDFLENNKEYGLVHHEADYFFQKSAKSVKNHHQTNKIFPSTGFVFEELLNNNNIYTPTVMFKASLLKHFMGIDENVRNKFLMGDYVMWLEFSQHCKFYYIPESMVTYRVLENSASKSTSYEKDLSFLNSYYDIKLFFMNRYSSKSIIYGLIEQARLSSSLSSSIKYKKNKNARFFASKLKLNNWRVLLKRILVFVPGIFRYIQKKNML
jgi:glycosyltransferase involved in cell wall biosynthesis